MAWTETARRRYCWDGLRYASNLTDAEWALPAPFMPAPAPCGRPRPVSLRVIVEAIFYMLTAGCQWRQLPREFAPFTTVQAYFYRFSRDGTLARINQALVAMARERAGRPASPTAGVIDSQPVKTTEAGGPRGFDAGKKIKGRKRHIVTDTLGNLVGLVIHPADVQDRDGDPDGLKSIRRKYTSLRHVFADGGYAGPKLQGRLEKIGKWTIQIVKRSDTAQGFELLPRRWASREPSPGLADAADSPRISRQQSPVQPPGSCSPISKYSHEKSHVKVRRAAVQRQTLSGDDFILFPRDHASRNVDQVIDMCWAAGFTPHIVQEAPAWQTAVSFVGSGLGVSILPDCVRSFRLPDVIYRDIDTDKTSTIQLLRQRHDARRLVENFCKLAQAAFHGRDMPV